MKMFKLLPFLTLLLVLGACQDREREVADEDDLMVEEADTWNEEEAMANWRDAWNQNDPQALEAATANDAVLFLEGKSFRQDSITAWIQNSASWMKDLSTTSVMKNRTDNIAYEAGTYTHSSTENDTLRGSGTYTVIWERGDDQEWSIKLMDVSPQIQPDSMVGTNSQMREE